MLGITFVMLSTALGAPPAPLPDNKTIDALTFTIGGSVFPPTGTLTVTADGKVSYRNQPDIWTTSSGGDVHKAEFDISKEDAAKLFAGLTADGLFDLPVTVRRTDRTRFIVSRGRWRLYLYADPIPEKLIARLQPLLEKADPAQWKKKVPAPVEKPAVTSFEFSFTTDAGHEVTFGLWRNGNTSYVRRRPANDPAGAGAVATESVPLGADEAAKLLDALVAAGVLDIEDAPKGARYQVQVFSGKWTIESHPAELPDAVLQHLRPLLEKADPTVWKKP